MTVTHFYSDNTYDQLENLNVNNDVQRLLLENMVLCNDASYNNDHKRETRLKLPFSLPEAFNMQKRSFRKNT